MNTIAEAANSIEPVIIEFQSQQQQDEEQHIPRPLNCFMIFRCEKQKEIASKCHGANHRDMSKVIAKWWRELPCEEKQVYVDRAKRLRLEHMMKYPNYRFKPKKKKRLPRTYKRTPADELVARDINDKQSLLSLYYHGDVASNASQSDQLLRNKLDIPAGKAPQQEPKYTIKIVDQSHYKEQNNKCRPIPTTDFLQTIPYSTETVDSVYSAPMASFPLSSISTASIDSPSSASMSRFFDPILIPLLGNHHYSTTSYSTTSEDDSNDAYSTTHYFQPQQQQPLYSASTSVLDLLAMLNPPLTYNDLHDIATIDFSNLCNEAIHRDPPIFSTPEEQLLSHYVTNPSINPTTNTINNPIESYFNYDSYYRY